MHRSLGAFLILLTAMVAGQLLMPVRSQGQGGGGGQVTLTPAAAKLITWSAAGGGVEESLQPGEPVITYRAPGAYGLCADLDQAVGIFGRPAAMAGNASGS